jgi:hypothetical protein
MTEITDQEKFQAINTGRCPRCKSKMYFIPSTIPGLPTPTQGHPSWLTCNEFEHDCTFNWEDVGDNIEVLILNSIYKFSRRNIQERLSKLTWACDKPNITSEHIRNELLSVSNLIGEKYRPANYIDIQ